MFTVLPHHSPSRSTYPTPHPTRLFFNKTLLPFPQTPWEGILYSVWQRLSLGKQLIRISEHHKSTCGHYSYTCHISSSYIHYDTTFSHEYDHDIEFFPLPIYHNINYHDKSAGTSNESKPASHSHGLVLPSRNKASEDLSVSCVSEPSSKFLSSWCRDHREEPMFLRSGHHLQGPNPGDDVSESRKTSSRPDSDNAWSRSIWTLSYSPYSLSYMNDSA